MSRQTIAILVVTFGLLTPIRAQELAGLSPPIHQVQVYADTRLENPPTYSGATYAALPGPGGSVEVQVFMPEVSGMLAYGYIVEFDDSGGSFTDNFTIAESYTWAEANIRDTAGWRKVRRRIDMPAPVGSPGPGRSILFTSPPSVSASGLIATFVLNAVGVPDRNRPLRFTVSAAVFSTTPPSRIWHYNASQAIYWR
jgi:hypothetical protein